MSSIDEKVTVQRMTADHLPQALSLSQALRWPYRLEDWAFALSLGTGLVVESRERLVGTAMWWPYGENFAATGMIIVSSEAQRRGIGAAMMAELLNQTADRTVILNSTLEGRSLYERKGFAALGNTVHQHQAVLKHASVHEVDGNIRALTGHDMAAVRALDQAASGLDRSSLIDALFAIGDVKVVEREGAVTGYGCVRTWGRGVVVGPIIATDAADARSLISKVASAYVGQFVRIDVTSDSGLSPWLTSIGLPDVGPVACMAKGTPPAPSGEATLFALSNQSLG